MYQLVADFLVLVHLAFVVFVVAGGLLVLWRPSLRWIHLSRRRRAGALLIEFTGWICPLTPASRRCGFKPGRLAIQAASSSTTFFHCSIREGLTPAVQIALGSW